MAAVAGAQVPRLAEELNERPFAIPEHFHSGSLPPAHAFADDGVGPVVMTVLKQCEDGTGVIVRAYEATGHASRARIELPFLGRTVEADFAPGEVKTFLVPEVIEISVKEVSLLEW